DPAEPGADIVAWEVGAITELSAHAGNGRVLLLWPAGAQFGASFNFQIYGSVQPDGPFALVGTTTSNFFVDSQLANNVKYYYRVSTIAWGSLSASSDIVSCTPREPVMNMSSPTRVAPDGVVPGTILGHHTHFGPSTALSSTTSQLSIPASSVIVLSQSLLLFDIETAAAPLGTATVVVETPDVWASLGAATYIETLSWDVAIEQPPSM